MEIPALSISQLLFPLLFIFLSILVLSPKFAHQSASFIFRLLATAHFTWRSDSPFHGPQFEPSDQEMPAVGDQIVPATDEELNVVHFRACGPESDEQEECVVCLNKIEEGEEIRELRCEHLFHRACLDQWIGYRHGTCPICRGSLPLKIVARMGGSNEEDIEDLMSQYSSFLGFNLHSVYNSLPPL
ncbi:E3 ubiquitin-protein ligase RHA2A-like [Magnolia sinica]|uniref:E3 ubiquitin-protein ligase RHA2A-like n=1 Tax=Magnolia sinica TaxID=86752 RepID=UPI00265888E9|nr:E3 ubiquitin-protein ligase RHA2A-like [Magnolia sinica]